MFATHKAQRSDDLGEPSFGSPSNGPRPRILVVESIRSTRELLGLVLEGTYRIDSVGTYEAALHLTDTTQFDAVLMSVNVSDVPSGMEALKKIRGRTGYEDVPIVVVIGPSLDAERAQLRDAGADAFLQMPFVRSELMDLLERCLPDGDSTSSTG